MSNNEQVFDCLYHVNCKVGTACAAKWAEGVNSTTELLCHVKTQADFDSLITKCPRIPADQDPPMYFAGCNFYINKGETASEPIGTAMSMHDCDVCSPEEQQRCGMKRRTELWEYNDIVKAQLDAAEKGGA